MKKMIFLLLLCVFIPQSAMAAGSLPPTASTREVSFRIDGKEHVIPKDMGRAYIDIKSGRTMVPVRYISENLNCYVKYTIINERGCFHVINLPRIVTMFDHDAKAYVIDRYDKSKDIGSQLRIQPLDAGAIIYDARAYVPIRFISEVMGFDVKWSRTGSGDIINISSGNNPSSATKPSANIKPPTIKNPSVKEQTNEVIRLVNIERAKVGVSPLKHHQQLENAANIRAKELRTLFSHRRPDGSSYSSLLNAMPTGLMGENIAKGYHSAEFVLKGWMHSPGHRRNILNPHYQYIGVGFDPTSKSWVQLFS